MKYVQARVVIFFTAQSVPIKGEKQSQNFLSPSHWGERLQMGNFAEFHPLVFPCFPPTFPSSLPLSVLSLKGGSNVGVQPKGDKSFKVENI